MSIGIYSDRTVDHFERPRNHGSFAAGGDVIAGSAGSRGAGVEFSFTAKVESAKIAAVRFRAFGCPHSIAAASWVSEHLAGASLEDVAGWRWGEVGQALDVPTAKRGRLLILEDAVHSLADNWRRKV